MPAERQRYSLSLMGVVGDGDPVAGYIKFLLGDKGSPRSPSGCASSISWEQAVKLLHLVPAEDRANADVFMFDVYVNRLETQDEANSREALCEQRRIKKEAHELGELARLTKKYGPLNPGESVPRSSGN